MVYGPGFNQKVNGFIWQSLWIVQYAEKRLTRIIGCAILDVLQHKGQMLPS